MKSGIFGLEGAENEGEKLRQDRSDPSARRGSMSPLLVAKKPLSARYPDTIRLQTIVFVDVLLIG